MNNQLDYHFTQEQIDTIGEAAFDLRAIDKKTWNKIGRSLRMSMSDALDISLMYIYQNEINCDKTLFDESVFDGKYKEDCIIWKNRDLLSKKSI